MAEVTLQINGKSYPVACEAGQENRITRLGAEINARVQNLSGGGARAADAHLLAMAALLLADELDEARSKAETAADGASACAAADAEAEQKLAGSLVSLARRIEAVAERIEAA